MPAAYSLLRDRVYAEIKEDILTGVLAPGERLQEAQLAQRFKTSKTPVREALARLVQEDLLRGFPRVGYVVTDCTVEDAQAILDFRAILEGAAIELAARYVTEAELAQLEAMVADLDFRSRDPVTYSEFFRQNREFHFVVAGASRNLYLMDAIFRVFDKVDRLLHYRLDLDESSITRMRDEHRAIVDALRGHDPEAARDALMLGLDTTKAEALKALVRVSRAELSAPPRAGGAPERIITRTATMAGAPDASA